MSTPLDLRPTRARCPGCGAHMTQLVMERGVLAGCRACGGIWIDHTVAHGVLAGAVPDECKRFAEDIARGHRDDAAPGGYRTAPVRADARLCPVCGGALVSKPFAERPFDLDLCEKDGTYFDLRELDAAIYDGAMNEAVAETERELQRHRLEQARREAMWGEIQLSLARSRSSMRGF